MYQTDQLHLSNFRGVVSFVVEKVATKGVGLIVFLC